MFLILSINYSYLNYSKLFVKIRHIKCNFHIPNILQFWYSKYTLLYWEVYGDSSLTCHQWRNQRLRVNLSWERKMILQCGFFCLLLFLIFKNVSHFNFSWQSSFKVQHEKRKIYSRRTNDNVEKVKNIILDYRKLLLCCF